MTRARELVPLTLRGAFVAGLSALALWYYGFEALDGVWYVMGLGLLAIACIALLSVVFAALRMKIWLARQGAHAPLALATETGRALPTGFAPPSLRFWLFVEVQLALRKPAQAVVETLREGAHVAERVRFTDHGELRELARTVSVRDVFGLTSIGLRRDFAVELDVLPHVGALRSLPLLRSLSGGDDIPHPMGIEQGDRLELRRYAAGDPARFIHWKVYARTQKLVVRTPERALSRAQRVAAYLVSGRADGASAAAARVALEEGAFGADFRFGADGSPTPLRALPAALVAIRRSSSARERSGEQLESFMQEIDREGPSSLVLFVPAEPGPCIERIGALLRKRARTARIVIGIDGVSQQQKATWLERLTLSAAGSTRTPVSGLRELMAAYQRFGCEVVVLDRETGRVLGDVHFARAPGAPPLGQSTNARASSSGGVAA